MTFGTKLQQLRSEKRMSQKEISAILKVSQTIYGKWESDIFYPTYKNLKKIAVFYNISTDALADVKDNRKAGKILISENLGADPVSFITIFKLLKRIEKTVLLIERQTEIPEKEGE